VRAADTVFEEYGDEGGPSLFGDDEDAEEADEAPAKKPLPAKKLAPAKARG
jgi:hypothetical protein